MAMIECAVDAPAVLGECPLWSDAERVLYWVDIDSREVHRFDPSTGVDESRLTPGRPGALALTSTPGRLLIAMEKGLVWLDWSSGTVQPWLDLGDPSIDFRLNDGRCDPVGRFVVGGISETQPERLPECELYRVDAAGAVVTLQRRITTTNGLAFDAQRERMYFADTATETVWVWTYDAATGERRDGRLFLDYAGLPGKPDGGCVDAAGCYWSASVYGWAVIRVTPDGVVDRRIELPVEKPSMPAFGSTDLNTLYVTTIGSGGVVPSAAGRDGFSPGCLLAIDAGVRGVPEPLFAG